jgi:hypothetical protein
MSTPVLARIEADIDQLSFVEQIWLLERLAQRIRAGALPQGTSRAEVLAAMAADPEMQHELRIIEAEFAGTETDGLAAT